MGILVSSLEGKESRALRNCMQFLNIQSSIDIAMPVLVIKHSSCMAESPELNVFQYNYVLFIQLKLRLQCCLCLPLELPFIAVNNSYLQWTSICKIIKAATP